ncbi:MAG: twin-arginine translocation signal domain-containing protein, partial [Gammaproteobacteria bacterium]
MTEPSRLSRRSFLIRTAAVGGALVLGFHLPSASRSWAAEDAVEEAEINAWIIIHPDDTVVIRVARSEMGQGIFTSLPMLVA